MAGRPVLMLVDLVAEHGTDAPERLLALTASLAEAVHSAR